MNKSLGLICLLLSLFKWSYGQSVDSSSDQPGYLIHSIYFGGGSYYIDENQQKELLDFIKSIEHLDRYDISVHAHTDNIGSKAYNDWLSIQRNRSVIDLLERFSIQRETIRIKAFGKYNPVYDNSTWMGRYKNRRVDIILWPIVF